MKKTFAFACFSLLLSAACAEPLVRSGDTIAFLGDAVLQKGTEKTGFITLFLQGLASVGITNVAKIVPPGGRALSTQLPARADRDCLAKKPDLLVVGCCLNDVWYGTNGVPFEAFCANLSTVYDKAAASNITVLALTPTMIGENEPDSDFNRKLARYAAWVVEECARREIPCVDLFSTMKAGVEAEWAKRKAAGTFKPDARFYTWNGTYMDFAGNCMIARALLQKVGIPASAMSAIERGWREIPGARRIWSGLSVAENEALRKHAGTNDLRRLIMQTLEAAGAFAEEK